MRITDNRYHEHLRRLNLAWRMISYEARTSTISRWTQLSGHRIRLLYKSYARDYDKEVQRHRGSSPYQLDTILCSATLKSEAAVFAAICSSLHVLPQRQPQDIDRTLPSIERGESLCDAFEWFRVAMPRAKLNFEQGLLVLSELSSHDCIKLIRCRTCLGVMLMDRLSIEHLDCIFCTTSGRAF